jgi:hypothetical protein
MEVVALAELPPVVARLPDVPPLESVRGSVAGNVAPPLETVLTPTPPLALLEAKAREPPLPFEEPDSAVPEQASKGADQTNIRTWLARFSHLTSRGAGRAGNGLVARELDISRLSSVDR